ncbi:PAS domain S-box-containing protein/diguanylate cyclase (GGDEF)-like protein/hemerythrin-like metal-binding protein [Rhodopseudomonas thermotolerans]|uniref:diguanylate cyclase n=2 Tax=Rhodopseudomonas TaxID=1073 RepID=A0A336K511_9BRAD|nr:MULTISPECIES: bacteriohemerythrin [Rhodopseudomonas]RED24447.1 PAS domain S-box-containing protein/diguanylate cyclase (GGDEF)-like protein/hemerythrin-like metal-binding protein [Rhodopseudomonas pentothenatexigens]REF90332.1 PAS domain S-box-containing protein/diguanylate cyclase (GGDEF)-like protein/hemerythrin-like metal-binding protein [Rhodopseudomonas thermotolerans]SSW93191.1 PAS domain S-box-containing protein/diguanylate cyclase (GGDEF)-like protein/hemerythrin-like metal-binding pr
MPLFPWNPLYETGDQRIDEQHRGLFDITNQLAGAIQHRDAMPKLSALIERLRDYARMHFCDEEALMRCSRLPAAEIDRHVCVHRTFLREVDRLAARTDLTDVEAAEAFLAFLINWLVGHILKLDRRIAQALIDRTKTDDHDELAVEEVLIDALMESERRFRMLSDEAPSLIWVSGRSGQRCFVNKAWYDFVGIDQTAATDIDWAGFVHPEDRERYLSCIGDVLATGRTATVEARVKTASGDWGWIVEKISPRISRNACIGLIAAATDITNAKASEMLLSEVNGRLEREVSERTRKLKLLALADPLTGLANRRSLLERIEREVARSARSGDELSLLFIDVDHFKTINDTLGHAAGDAALIEVARLIGRSLRSTDFVGRLGGEEFVAVLVGTGEAGACEAAETVRRTISRHDFDGLGRPVTVSIGVSTHGSGDNGTALLDRADHAMLQAKRDGRNRCRSAGRDGHDRLSA